MERLFSPCTRFHDLLESQGRLEHFRCYHPGLLQELNLDVSTEELLSAERAFACADLFAMLGNRNTVAWLTPHAAVARGGENVVYCWGRLDVSYRFCFSADGKDIFVLARSHDHLLEICDIVVRLLAASVVQSVIIQKFYSPGDASINATSLAYLMEQCQSLKALTLKDLEIDEDQIRALGGYSRPDLEIVLTYCKLTSAGARALAEVLGRNKGPTQLEYCEIDNLVLADGLRGNSRLQLLEFRISSSLEVGNRQIFAIAGALRENKGLVELNLTCGGFRVSDEAWGAICASLETHLTLEVFLLFRVTFAVTSTDPAVTKSRVQALLDMMKVNTSIHTLQLDYRYREHTLFRESVIPYLQTNRFRMHIRAIQKIRPIPYRVKVLGRALLSARTNPNRFWVLLSGNLEVVLFPSTTATTTPVASLPTPAARSFCCRFFYCNCSCWRRYFSH
jgi:hypothetical protein